MPTRTFSPGQAVYANFDTNRKPFLRIRMLPMLIIQTYGSNPDKIQFKDS